MDAGMQQRAAAVKGLWSWHRAEKETEGTGWSPEMGAVMCVSLTCGHGAGAVQWTKPSLFNEQRRSHGLGGGIPY